MSAPHARRDAQTVTFAAVLVLLTGCVFVFRADEVQIGERIAADRRIVAQLASAERTLRARGRLERERDALRARLRSIDLDGDRTAVAARFVRDAAGIAARHHTTIASIAAVGPARAGTPASSSAPASASVLPSAPGTDASQRPGTPAGSAAPSINGPVQPVADTFDALPLDLTVEGRYADVLATIAALSSARIPTVVDVASLARKQAGSSAATLSAQLHVVLQRLAPAVSAGAATRPA